VSRDTLLARVRAAVLPPAAAELPLLPAPQTLDDPVAVFIDRARDLGVGVERVASIQEAGARIAALLAARGVRRAAVWETPDLVPALDRLRAESVELVGPESPVETIAQAGAGVTGAEWGIAETATVVLPSGPGRPRLASLLPPLHLVILRAGRILPDLHALFLRGGTLPSSLTLITGPSRSADIGSVLILGAHGPTEVIVVLVGE
jgi:L-lactate utilization protein LutC